MSYRASDYDFLRVTDIPERKRLFFDLLEKRKAESAQKWRDCLYTALREDFFARFVRDPELSPAPGETAVTDGWTIECRGEFSLRMGALLAKFFDRFGARVSVTGGEASGPRVTLAVGGGRAEKEESFTLAAEPGHISVLGRDEGGLRNGVARLVGLMGLRRAPFLPLGETVYAPRVPVRKFNLRGMPFDLFYGANAVELGYYSLFALSESDAIPELIPRRDAAMLDEVVQKAKEAQKYGMKTYIQLATVDKFKEDDPIFPKYPGIRGARTWAADGDFVLCTEHPRTKQYLSESIRALFRRIEGLDGATVIIGGESFYHCYMRPWGAEKGHTNCPRCEKLGAERTVANLCNLLARAAREVNPRAEIVAWPYSAAAVWSKDRDQEAFMRLLEPGVSLLTELEKDELSPKPGGVIKRMWDYSIDGVGPGSRAARQIEVSRETGVPVHALSMAEMSFEDALLPGIPALDRWTDRARALADAGFTGAYVWNMGPASGMCTGEPYPYAWFEPVPDKEEFLTKLAARITGRDKCARGLREAWREASRAVDSLPMLFDYYRGPQFIGPAHPFAVYPDTPMPPVFDGLMLYLMEANVETGMVTTPLYSLNPADYLGAIDYHGGAAAHRREIIPVLEALYQTAADCLARAVESIDGVESDVPERSRVVYESETLPIRWFRHSVLSTAHLMRVFRLWQQKDDLRPQDKAGYFQEMSSLFQAERENAVRALPIARKDARIDTTYRGDFSAYGIADMLDAKIALIEREIAESLPRLKAELGV